MNKAIKTQKPLDQEWVALILEALALGISHEEIRKFLKENSHELTREKTKI